MLNGDSKTVLYLSIVFSKKCNLQTGVQTFLFLSGIKNRWTFYNLRLVETFIQVPNVVYNFVLEHSGSSFNRTFT